MALPDRLARGCLSLYPRAWRARYLDEAAAMLADRPASTSDVVDLLRGAVREQVWPTVREPDSSAELIARGVLAGVLSWGLSVLEYGVLRVWAGPWSTTGGLTIWLLPYLIACLTFILGRRLLGSARRGWLAGAVIVSSVAIRLADVMYLGSLAHTWGTSLTSGALLAWSGSSLFAVGVMLSAMAASQAAVVFVVLESAGHSADRTGSRGMKRADDALVDLGRFSEPALYVLISLADGPKHGYAMAQDIEAMVGQRLGPGTLYGAISRLEGRGWITPLPSVDRRRPYRLTAVGRRILRDALEHLRGLARVGQARLRHA